MPSRMKGEKIHEQVEGEYVGDEHGGDGWMGG